MEKREVEKMATNYPCPSCGMQIPYQSFQAGTQCFCPGCTQPSKAPDDQQPGDGGVPATPVGVGTGSGLNASAQAGGAVGDSTYKGLGGTPAPIPPQSGGFGGGAVVQDAWQSVDTLAGLGSRFGAAMVDFGCVAVLYFLFFMMAGNPGAAEFGEAELGGAFLFLAGGIIVLAVTQIYLLTTCGQTIGKKIVGIKIVNNEDGSEGGFVKNVLMRGFVNGLISSVPFVGAIYALVDILFIFRQDRRCIHDLIAGTKVINA